jgi:hypothetical protein
MAAIPYAGQAAGWPAALRRRYDALLARCDRRTVLQQRFTGTA